MSRGSLEDLRKHLKHLADVPLQRAGFDRDLFMMATGKAELARFILNNFLKDPQEDLEHVLR